MRDVFKNLVKLAYLNPEYRKELFILLGVGRNNFLKKADDSSSNDNSAVNKIKEDAQKGIFSGYTLGVLTAYYSTKNRKFKNPNPEGGKDVIAMSTLVKYYSEREKKPEYKKFETDTIRALQGAFNEFYQIYEAQHEKQEQEKNEGDNEFEGMTDEEIADYLEVKEKRSKIKGLKNYDKNQDKERQKEIEKQKIVSQLKELNPFGDMSEEEQKETLEKMYASIEENFYDEKEGKVYLKTGLEDNERTRALIKDLIRDSLTNEKIDNLFNETGAHRYSNWLTKTLSNTGGGLFQSVVKSYVEDLEKNTNLYIKIISLPVNVKEFFTGEEINFNKPEMVEKYLDYIDKKYNQQVDPAIRLSMKKNTQVVLNLLKSGSDATGLTDGVNKIVQSAVENISNSETVGHAVQRTKEFSQKVFKGKAFQNLSNDIGVEVNSKIHEQVDVSSLVSVSSMFENIVKDNPALNSVLSGDKEAIEKLFRNTFKDYSKDQVSAIIDSISKNMKSSIDDPIKETLASVIKDLEKAKLNPISWEDSSLSTVSNLVDVVGKVDDITHNVAVETAKTTLNTLEADIENIPKAFQGRWQDKIKEKIGSAIDEALKKQGLVGVEKDTLGKEIDNIANIDIKAKTFSDLINEQQKNVDTEISEKALGVIKKINQMKEKIQGDTPGVIHDKLNETTAKITDTINDLTPKAQGLAGKGFDELRELQKEYIDPLKNADLYDMTEKGLEKLHGTIEQGKNKINDAISSMQDEIQGNIDQIKQLEEGATALKNLAKNLPQAQQDQLNDLLKVSDSVKQNMQSHLKTSLDEHLKILKEDSDKFIDNLNVSDSTIQTVAEIGKQAGAIIGYADMALKPITKMAMNKLTRKLFLSQVEAREGKKGRIQQELINHILTPQDYDDEYRKKFKEINDDESLNLNEKAKKLTSLLSEYDTDVKPAIAYALYALGKRDATGKDIEGFWKQTATRLKLANDDEFDFTFFYVKNANDPNEILSENQKAEILKNHIKANSNKKDSIPIIFEIQNAIDKSNLLLKTKKGLKKFRDSYNMDDLMDNLTGKKGIDIKDFQESKDHKLKKFKKKKNPKSK